MIYLRVPGSLRYRDLAVRVISAACKLVGLADATAAPVRLSRQWDHEVVSAFGEAFNNTAIHSFRDNTPGDVEIDVDIGATYITIRLVDYGKSFQFEKVPAPDLDSLPESGLGLYIMRSFMDEVDYRAGTPNVLCMTKYLPDGDGPVGDELRGDHSGGESLQ